MQSTTSLNADFIITYEWTALFSATRKFHLLSLDKLLYGSNEPSVDENNEIFMSMQLFIQNSKCLAVTHE